MLADTKSLCGYYKKTPLMIAAERGWLDVLQLLIEIGADPNDGTVDGENVLHAVFEYPL